MPFAEKQRRPIHRVHPYSAGGARWTRKSRHDLWTGQKRSTKQQIIIFAHAGSWWVQPWPDYASIPIKADSTWSAETHLGFEYTALLAEPDYHPLPRTDVAATQGDSITLVTIVKGGTTPQLNPTGSLKFSGYDRRVRVIASIKGGTNNLYDPENAWTDASGALHMQIRKKLDRWSCAEIFLNRSLGYGTACSCELSA